MRILRILLAAAAVVVAMFAGFFVLAIVAVIGLIVFLLHSARRKTNATVFRPGSQSEMPVYRDRSVMGGDVIDIEATRVSDSDQS